MFFNFISPVKANYEKLAYEFTFEGINDDLIDFNKYKNKVIVVVNVASRCGFTNQYEDLQKIWSKYKDDNLMVVGIPTNNFKQEPGSDKDIKEFCETNFGISFPISKKTDVIGNNAHPFYKWAKNNHGSSAIPKWNFHKIIINKKGIITETFSSITKPTSKKFISLIEKEIKN